VERVIHLAWQAVELLGALVAFVFLAWIGYGIVRDWNKKDEK
jgi:hypothetical protein